MPVTVPSKANPIRSICLRDATSAPDTAKTITPNQSRIVVRESKDIARAYLDMIRVTEARPDVRGASGGEGAPRALSFLAETAPPQGWQSPRTYPASTGLREPSTHRVPEA